MARSLGIVKTSIWADEEFRALRRAEQRAYILLLSQAQITNCGVLAYTPRKWSKYAIDDSPADIEAALRGLHEARFVVLDEDTEEVLVRTFVRHDRIEAQPRLVDAAKREFREIESEEIRSTLRRENPGIFAHLAEPRPLGQGVLEGLAEPLGEPLREPLAEGDNARARGRARGVGEGEKVSGSSTPPTRPPSQAKGDRKKKLTKRQLAKFTGARAARGTHGATYVHDPLGTDKPPKDWPHEPPTEIEVVAAQLLDEANGHFDGRAAIDELVARGHAGEDLILAIATWRLEPDEVFALADYAADQQRIAS